jgi:hypothetical protein
LDFIGILARTTIPVSKHALEEMLVPTDTSVLALTVTHRKLVVSKNLMTNIPVLNPWSRTFGVPVTGLSTW